MQYLTRHLFLKILVYVIALTLTAASSFALGSDHPDKVDAGHWPKGMSSLVNIPERIHGYFVNAEDVFFFFGDQSMFDDFLEDYAAIDGVVEQKIVVRRGIGEAKSPWDKGKGVRCDWMIRGVPASWEQCDPNAKGYLLEIHIWEDGRIEVPEGDLPGGVIVERAKDIETTPETVRLGIRSGQTTGESGKEKILRENEGSGAKTGSKDNQILIQKACVEYLREMPLWSEVAAVARSIDHSQLKLVKLYFADDALDRAMAFVAVGDNEQPEPGTLNNDLLWECHLEKRAGQWIVARADVVPTIQRYQDLRKNYRTQYPDAYQMTWKIPKAVVERLHKTLHRDYRRLLGAWKIVSIRSTKNAYLLEVGHGKSKPGSGFSIEIIDTPVGVLSRRIPQWNEYPTFPSYPIFPLAIDPHSKPAELRFASHCDNFPIFHYGIYQFEENGDLSLCINFGRGGKPKNFEFSGEGEQILLRARKVSVEPLPAINLSIQKDTMGELSQGAVAYVLNSEWLLAGEIEDWLRHKLQEMPEASLRIKFGDAIEQRDVKIAEQAARLAGLVPERIIVLNRGELYRPKEPVELRLTPVGTQGKVKIKTKQKLGGMLWLKEWPGERVRINGVEYQRDPDEVEEVLTGLASEIEYDPLEVAWKNLEGRPAPQWKAGDYRVQVGLGFIRGGTSNGSELRIWSDEVVVELEMPVRKTDLNEK